ncbi:helicase-related protein [Aurantimonas sp. Leaf443]|uniref:helicase-related protein n=1 Tax=Aurantimonas sp. Leaf443 TaxID=1736378 RepID=UPI0006FCB066|nr:helicase-related protein [Aurantimonas sp. Leaf443]KQT85165.1 helicase [Aurantimonas sp. Leaf443]
MDARTIKAPASAAPQFDGTRVTAVLGPTNTGKTFYAIERMIAHSSGTIGLPLRLLAREVYQKVCDRVGAASVSLITGEEKIKPPNARYVVCTVEAMPRDPGTAFVAIDEVQLAADLERGHVFTDRILHARGREETLLLGSGTMQGVLQRLLKGVQVVTRPRLSQLLYAGQKKITRLPRRSAIVAFSAEEVYAIAELIRRQRGGAAVVLGALSPRTRNAQVALYQAGEVDFLVATDAIGMGLNLDVDHVAFAQDWKFDGFQYRQLTPAEYGQIAGRAGRHLKDGTFGVTGQVDPIDPELVEQLEAHAFPPVRVLQWRNRDLDFSSLEALHKSLEKLAPNEALSRALPSVDQRAFEFLSRDGDVRRRATSARRVEMLWEACKLPDYRRIAPAQHAEIIAAIYADLADRGAVAEDYMASQVERADRMEGDIDTLSQRVAEIRTWTYISHRPGWLADPTHWQEKTRAIEDRLSDALHERLTKRFVDRRTSVLMKRLRENAFMEAEIGADGTVLVEGHHVGELQGFRFTPDTKAEGPDGRAVRMAAQKALAGEFEKRAERFANAPNGDLALGQDGLLRWLGSPIAMMTAGEDALKPRAVLLADEQLTGPARDKVAARADRFVSYQVSTVLKPLADLKAAEGLEAGARGIAYRLVENFGLLERREIAEEVRGLDQEARAALRRLGVRFGAYHIFVPTLVKPAPAALLTLLWGVAKDGSEKPGFGEVPQLLSTGRTSAVADPSFDPVFYRLAGYRLLGRRAVRVDILERLADLIRPALAWKPGTPAKRPEGAYNGSQFVVTPAMMSILGATADDMDEILKGLDYRPQSVEAGTVEAEIERQNASARAAAAAKAAEASAAASAGETATESREIAAADPIPSEASSEEIVPEDVMASDEAAGEDATDAAVEPVEAADETSETPDEAPLPASATEGVEAVVSTYGASATVAPVVEASETADAPVETPESDQAEPAAMGEAASTDGAAEAKPAVEQPVKMVQLWRPGRSGERGGRRERGGRPGQGGRGRQGGEPAGGGEATGRQGGERRDGDRQKRFGADKAPRGERPAGGNPRPAREGDRAPGGAKPGQKFGNRPERGERGERPERERNGGNRSFEKPRDAAPRPQRIDPDSPFAKLAALKDKLGK